MFSDRVLLGLPTGPSAFNSKLHTFLHLTILTFPHHICPYHSSLPPLIIVMIGSNFCSSVFHLIICISALSNFNPTTTSKGLVSLPKVMLLRTQLTYTRLQWGSSGCQKWQPHSELHPSISDSSRSSKIRSTISIECLPDSQKLFTYPYVSPYTN